MKWHDRYGAPRAGPGAGALMLVAAFALIGGCAPAPTPPSGAAASPDPATVPATGTVEKVDAPGIARLLESARGKPVVVNLWATWCAPCVAELPEFVAFYREHSAESVAFLAISLDPPSEIDSKVIPFLRQRNIPFPVYVLTERDVDAVSVALRREISGALPTTLVYDSQGNIVQFHEGVLTRDELNAWVRPLL